MVDGESSTEAKTTPDSSGTGDKITGVPPGKADVNVNELDEEDEDIRCGYRSCRPECLQKCNIPQILLVSVCWFTFTQGFVVNGINNVNTATIERRFEIPSKQVAWISSSYDVCAGILAVTFGYLGTFLHKGRMLMVGAYFLALGSFTMFLPHILAGKYELGARVSELCDPNSNSTDCSGSESSSSNYFYVFIIGQVLHGVGGSALYTLAIPYMDDNIQTKDTPLYTGLMLAFSAIGPAFGYIVGGLLLNVYVDIGRVDMDTIEISPGDPRWVGAWWIGFLYSSMASLTVAVLMGCFGKELPSAKKYRAERKSEAHKGKGENKPGDKGEFQRSWSDTFYSLKVIFKNPVWILLTIAGTVESGAVVAFATFLPKVIQFQFAQPPAMAAVMAGIVVIPGVTLGHILGGLVPRWYKMKTRGLLGECVVSGIVGLCLFFIFLMRCEMPKIAGVNTAYFNSSIELDEAAVVHPCNYNCSCSTWSYDPVCGVDGLEYFTPCHAGCLEVDDINGDKSYTDCSCVQYVNQTEGSYEATAGVCGADCTWLPAFLAFFFVVIFVTFFSNTAGQSATIRIVPDKYRTFGFGIQQAIIRYLGNVPFPIMIGAIFDLSCEIWQEDDCGTTGSCWIYDNMVLAHGITGCFLAIKTISICCFLGAYLLYKPPPEENEVIEMVVEAKTDEEMMNAELVSKSTKQLMNNEYTKEIPNSVGQDTMRSSLPNDIIDANGQINQAFVDDFMGVTSSDTNGNIQKLEPLESTQL